MLEFITQVMDDMQCATCQERKKNRKDWRVAATTNLQAVYRGTNERGGKRETLLRKKTLNLMVRNTFGLIFSSTAEF